MIESLRLRGEGEESRTKWVKVKNGRAKPLQGRSVSVQVQSDKIMEVAVDKIVWRLAKCLVVSVGWAKTVRDHPIRNRSERVEERYGRE